MIKNLKIGADPELFLITENGVPYPACGKIGGTKSEPLFFTEQGHAVQEDNVAVEFCIPPCETSTELQENISICLDHINLIKPKETIISRSPSLYFREEDLQSDQAKLFGCSATFNHWTLRMNRPPKTNTTLRTCGGHIHLGWENPEEKDCIGVLAALELFLGVPSIIMDTDEDRRKLYGKSGEFRFKPYGVEWRVLSNFWIFSPIHISWVWEGIKRAVEFVNNKQSMSKDTIKSIIHTINTSDTRTARELCEHYNIIHFTHKIIDKI